MSSSPFQPQTSTIYTPSTIPYNNHIILKSKNKKQRVAPQECFYGIFQKYILFYSLRLILDEIIKKHHKNGVSPTITRHFQQDVMLRYEASIPQQLTNIDINLHYKKYIPPMQFLKTFRSIEYIHFLVKTSATGNPESFARRMSLSKRQLLRLITDLRDLGLPIVYSRSRRSYYYKAKVDLGITIKVDDKGLNK